MLADVDVSRPDGTRSHVTEVVSGFARAGRAVELVARGTDPRLAGVRFHRADAGRGRVARILGMNRTALGVLLRSRARTRTLYYRYDAGLVATVLVARLLGYRAVGEMNNVMFGADYADRDPGLRGRLVDALKVGAMRVAARHTAAFVAVTDRIKDILVREYGTPAERVHVLRNGVNVERFRVWDRAEAIARAGLDPECRYVVFVGLLASWVDLPTILRAFARVAATRPDVRLVLVGDGPQAPYADELARELGVAELVVRPGFVTDRDLVSAYTGAATVCVIAYDGAILSRIGVSPMKLTEYFAAGRAVVGTDLEGATQMIRESGGGVSVPAEPAAVADALGELLDDLARADALGRAGRRAAEEQFSWASVVGRTLHLLDGAAR